MNEIQSYVSQEFGSIRTIVKDGEPWFVAKDVSDILGFTDAAQVTRWLEKEEQTTLLKVQGLNENSGLRKDARLVSESGLYSLIFRSNKPEAKRFKKWVTSEVLPSIRKHGMYATGDIVDQMLADPDAMIRTLEALKVEREKRKESDRRVAVLSHVNKTYTATEIAKEAGLKSAIAMNKELHERGIQFKQNGTWVLYSKYAQLGLVEIKQEVLDNGKVIYHRRFTQYGREFVLNLFSKPLDAPAVSD